MPILLLNELRKSSGTRQVLSGVDLQVTPGQVTGLVGRNGSGKSAVAGILAGESKSYAGLITLGGVEIDIRTPQQAAELGIGVARQKMVLLPNFDVADNFSLGTTTPLPHGLKARREMRVRAEELVARYDLPIDLDAPLEALTAAEQEWIQVGRALLAASNVVVFDETDTRLGPDYQNRFDGLLAQLRGEGRAILYISHDLEQVLRRSDTVAILANGRTETAGPAQNWDSASLGAAVQGRQDAPVPHRRGQAAASGTAVELVQFGPRKGAAVSMEIPAGAVLGVVGQGSFERRAFLAALGGESPSRGQARIAERTLGIKNRLAARQAGIHYIPADQEKVGPMRSRSLAQTLMSSPAGDDSWIGSAFSRIFAGSGEGAMSIAEQLDALIAQAEQPTGADEPTLLVRPRLVILDRPTIGLDVVATQEIYRQIERLRASGATVLLASDSLAELKAAVDAVIVLREDEVPFLVANEDLDQGIFNI